jgi:hypothetical protein
MEAFHNLMENVGSLGIFHVLKCPNVGPKVSHLLFLDDAIIIGEWSMENVKNLCRLLRVFNLVSGLKVNLKTCSIFWLNVQDEELKQYVKILHYKEGNLPFRYLGIMVGTNMNRMANWSLIIDIFQTRLSKWKARQFSIGGRWTLIKLVMENLSV